MKFCVRKRKKFEESAAPPSPGENVVLEVEVGDEVEIRKQDADNRSPLDELKRIAEGRGELQLKEFDRTYKATIAASLMWPCRCDQDLDLE